ncbi:MAG: hypothetical protein LVQ96_02080 [Thermoplasmatales archaeon]|nr:hypothetical protein [Thermoplasmatales archaeon]MCW6169939.1 hypothetical protein [Thermoplasmatales archaeon]
MKKIFILVLVVSLSLALTSVSLASPFQDRGQMVFGNLPEVYINTTNNQSFNVSYSSITVTNDGTTYHFPFNFAKWDFKKINGYQNEYSATVDSIPVLSGMMNITDQNITGQLPNFSFEKTVNVNIITNRTTGYLPNSTEKVTTLEITIEISSSSFQGSGNVSLYQFLGAGTLNHTYFSLNHYKFSNYSKERNYYLNITGEKNVNAYYWWNTNYTMNDKPEVLGHDRSRFIPLKLFPAVVFTYQFNATNRNHSFSIVQDPFFSVPTFNLLNHTVIYNALNNIREFLYEHIEFLGAGLATGFALLGTSYGYYRKKHI